MFHFKAFKRLGRGSIGILRLDVFLHAILSKKGTAINLPIFFLAGIAVIATCSACLFAMNYLDNQELISYMENPEIGDVYIVKEKDEPSEFRYCIWRAAQVYQDSIYIIKNIYVYDAIPELMMEDDAFIDIHYVIEMDTLISLYQSGQIVYIRRSCTEYDGFNRVIRAELDYSPTEDFR